MRPPRLLPLALLLAVACSDGDADPTPPGGGAPPGVADRAEALRGQAVDRRLEGASFETIADELAAEADVVEALASDSALVFVVEGGAPTWIHAPPERAELPEGAFTSTATRGDSLVIRPAGRVERAEDKTALLIDPFYWQFGVDLAPRAQRIEAFRDWQSATLKRNPASFAERVSDADFTGWNDYSFVWVSTHGDRLPTTDPKYTILFNSNLCGASQWARQTALLNLDNSPADQRISLLGFSESQMRRRLSLDEQRTLDEFLKAERDTFTAAGKTCQVMEMSFDGQKQMLYWTAYDKGWFERQPKLENTVVLLSACSSTSLPLRVDDDTGTMYGWSKPVAVQDDRQTLNAFFRLAFEEGYTPQGLEDELLRLGLERSMFAGDEALFGFDGSPLTRLRESVNVIDPDTFAPVEGRAVFRAREVTAAGATLVDMDFELIGLEGRRADAFELRVEQPDGTLLRSLTPVPTRDADGLARTNLEITLPYDVEASPGPHPLVAKLMLPADEDGRAGRAFGVHAFDAVFEPPRDQQWSVRGMGVDVGGDLVLPTTVRAVPDGDGTLLWTLQLQQSDDEPTPTGTLTLLGHPGRNMDCTGDTGRFDARLAIQIDETPEGLIANDPDDPMCGGINVEITSFSRDDDFVAELSGTVCRARVDMMGELTVEPVAISGRIGWPEAGCGGQMPGPGEGFIGSYRVLEEPNVCQDIYQNSAIAPGYDALCAMSGTGLMCSDDPCPRMNRIGSCDARNASAQSVLRGAIWHYYEGFDSTAADLAMACATQGGVWEAGGP